MRRLELQDHWSPQESSTQSYIHVVLYRKPRANQTLLLAPVRPVTGTPNTLQLGASFLLAAGWGWHKQNPGHRDQVSNCVAGGQATHYTYLNVAALLPHNFTCIERSFQELE